MDASGPNGPDINHGTEIFIGCWTLTGIVCLVLLLRYSVKAWMYWTLPKVSAPAHIWCYDDLFYLLGFILDLIHMSMVWKSWKWGLGRHFFYLDALEKTQAMKWAFVSQPIAVSAAMCSRTGVVVFLYSCLAHNARQVRYIVIICGLLQVIVNLFTILQIILQCGPNPYRLANRAAYFHYMWDQLPETNSIMCQPPMVQVTIGYVQGAFNSVVDFGLTYLAAFEIWQVLLRVSSNGPRVSWIRRLMRLDSNVRRQRVWQSVLLCGPLLLSGIASIVKTHLLSAVGSRSDFTRNIVPFILWVKIENSSIPISTCGPVLRLFARTFMDRYGSSSLYLNSPDPRSRQNSRAFELANRSARTNTGSRGFTNINDRKEILWYSINERTLNDSELDLPQRVYWSYKSRATMKGDFG